jgi:two-component system NtrC family sensor kinase
VLQTEKLSALGRMAAGVAHEINNPLAGILIYSTNMIKKVPDQGALKEGLEVIIHETIRCRTIIQELLEFSRQRQPQRMHANINDILEKALTILENEFRLCRIRLKKDLSPQMPRVLLDAGQMQQVFVNLLINALEAIRENGEISIRSCFEAEQKNIRIEIAEFLSPSFPQSKRGLALVWPSAMESSETTRVIYGSPANRDAEPASASKSRSKTAAPSRTQEA